MKRDYFLALEPLSAPQSRPLAEVLDQLPFDERGLIPVLTQDADTRQVLMLAWMNRDALEATIDSGAMTYWSRSRQALWRKGETSGNTQQLVSMSLDCDGDAVLCQVQQQGPACHTGRQCCFYLTVDTEHRIVRLP